VVSESTAILFSLCLGLSTRWGLTEVQEQVILIKPVSQPVESSCTPYLLLCASL
jgi:hypothetical protein